MKKSIKALLSISMCATVLLSSAIIAGAQTPEADASGAKASAAAIIPGDQPQADVIVWKFKSQNGHLYKRRFNQTRGVWYDPAWILVR